MARGARTRCLELCARHVIAVNFVRDCVPSPPPSSLLPQARRRHAFPLTHLSSRIGGRSGAHLSTPLLSGSGGISLGLAPDPDPPLCVCPPLILPAPHPLLTPTQRASASAADTHVNVHARRSLLALRCVSVPPSGLTDLVLELSSICAPYAPKYSAVDRLLAPLFNQATSASRPCPSTAPCLSPRIRLALASRPPSTLAHPLTHPAWPPRHFSDALYLEHRPPSALARNSSCLCLALSPRACAHSPRH
jgi:hypothetical protein